MILTVYDYTQGMGNIIMQDDDYNKADAIFWKDGILVTIEGKTYEIFEIKISAYVTSMDIAVRLN